MREISSRLAGAGDATSPEAAGPLVLAAIGETVEWDVAGLWVEDGGLLHAVHRWAVPCFEAAANGMEDESLRLRPGEGIPGGVYATGEAASVEDVRCDPNFPRRSIAEQYGLRSCFAFPIVTHGRVMAVVECCSGDRRDTDANLVRRRIAAGRRHRALHRRGG